MITMETNKKYEEKADEEEDEPTPIPIEDCWWEPGYKPKDALEAKKLEYFSALREADEGYELYHTNPFDTLMDVVWHNFEKLTKEDINYLIACFNKGTEPDLDYLSYNRGGLPLSIVDRGSANPAPTTTDTLPSNMNYKQAIALRVNNIQPEDVADLTPREIRELIGRLQQHRNYAQPHRCEECGTTHTIQHGIPYREYMRRHEELRKKPADSNK